VQGHDASVPALDRLAKEHTTMPCILIIDDDPLERRLLTLVLDGAAEQVLTADSALAALDLFTTGVRPTVIVSDVMMPGMLGTELAQHLAQQPDLASIPIILTSAHHALLHDCQTAACVGKPFDPQALRTLVSELLHESRAARNASRTPRLLRV